MKRSDVQVLGKLLAEDEIVKIKRADEPIETEGVLESLPKQISKRSEVKEVHQELLPGGKLTNVGETDEFLELIAEGKLIKDSLKLPKSMDSLPDEEEVVKELTELLQSSKDRYKKELLPDPELPELRRSRRNDKTSSEESIVKELIDDIQLQTKKARKLPRIRARAITALPSRDLHALGEDASEPEGPGDHRQTRSNAGEHGLQELSPGALEDDSSLLEPLVQGSGEGTRRRRSVSETNDLELRHSADRFSRYERETANEQAGEGPKSLPAETYDPYPLDESLDLRQGRNVELVDREQSPDVDPQEQPETINTESLKSPKMLDDVNLQEGSFPAVESMAPQYVQDYNKAPELQPESGRAADLFWYRVSPDDELKAEEGANEGNKNATQAEGKGHERKGKTDSQKEAGTVRHEGDKRADDSSAAEDQKKTAASDTNRNDRSVEKENYSDNADNIDLTPEAQK
ncbi:uncharacterized protein LOC119591008 [Penaeus monodon]|uniref:uncharacterized protein LOC119591008 n=1 Tax=Penaeus monodon TaxID=6687 RepID=UPI0018A6F83C|nr:uncharacterized protein LOC119591008 [Penaeus monodon]